LFPRFPSTKKKPILLCAIEIYAHAEKPEISLRLPILEGVGG